MLTSLAGYFPPNPIHLLPPWTLGSVCGELMGKQRSHLHYKCDCVKYLLHLYFKGLIHKERGESESIFGVVITNTVLRLLCDLIAWIKSHLVGFFYVYCCLSCWDLRVMIYVWTNFKNRVVTSTSLHFAITENNVKPPLSQTFQMTPCHKYFA